MLNLKWILLKNFLIKFLGLTYSSQQVAIACDCDIYTDMNLLLENLIETLSNDEMPESDIENVQCQVKKSNKIIKI